MIVMIVSPSFPPFSGVGGVRMYSLASYLQDKGYSVIVLRNSIKTWGDENCKSECRDFYRIVDVDFYVDDNYKVRRISIDAYKRAIKSILDSESIDVIVYSCSPFYNAITAVEIKREYGIKTIIDYRDLWINEEHYTRNILKRIKKKLLLAPYWNDERKSIIDADKVITVTPEDCKVLKRKYVKYASKICCVYNGFDKKRILDYGAIDVSDYNLPEKYIGIFGKFAFYDIQYAIELLKAIKVLNEHGKNIKLVHIGKKEAIDDRAIQESGIPKELYVNLGYQDYPVGIRILEKAAAGCLIVHYKRGLGTKIFDYIMINKPVIYFAQKGCAIDRLLSGARNSFRCDSCMDAIDAVKTILSENLKEIGMDNREQFSRENTNKVFEEVILNTIG